MSATLNSKSSETGFTPVRRLLSAAFPALLLVAFLGQQIIHLDSIGLNNGFSHPLTGWDHLLTMLAVGIWAAQLRGQAIWMLPLAFVVVMSLGGLAGASGLCIPSVESIILLSCAVFSVLITRKVRFSSKVNVLIVAFFAFFHGFAHGQEISTSASLISYTLGFMLATLLLHGAGILLAKLLVFSISFLLTMMFSTSALATASITRVDYNFDLFSQQIQANCSLEIITASSVLNIGLTQNELKGANHICKISDSVNKTSFTNQHSAFKLPVSSCSVSGSDIINGQGLPALQPLGTLTYALLFNSGLYFKRFFPDINQTPGRNLLSNGVGATSPPSLLNSASTVKFSSALCSSHASSSVKELGLQLPNTLGYTRKFSSKTIPYTNTICPEPLVLPVNYLINLGNYPDKALLSSIFVKSKLFLQPRLG
jgi:urease accessory protein